MLEDEALRLAETEEASGRGILDDEGDRSVRALAAHHQVAAKRGELRRRGYGIVHETDKATGRPVALPLLSDTQRESADWGLGVFLATTQG